MFTCYNYREKGNGAKDALSTVVYPEEKLSGLLDVGNLENGQNNLTTTQLDLTNSGRQVANL